MGAVGDLPGSPSYAAIFSSDGPSSFSKKQATPFKSLSPEHLVKRDAGDAPSLEETDGEGSAMCAKVCVTGVWCV